MSIKSVEVHFKEEGLPLKVIEFEASTATIPLAAQTLGVDPGTIIRALVMRLKDRDILVLASGNARIDNRKYKSIFKTKAKFVGFDEVEKVTGHPVGGVSPFGLLKHLDIFIDHTLKSYNTVYPAGGTPSSAIEISLTSLVEYVNAEWTDVCVVHPQQIIHQL